MFETNNGELILAQPHIRPMFFMVIVFISYTLGIGTWLAVRLNRSAVHAQDIVMFPDEYDLNNFFHVPDFTMAVLDRYTFKISQALEYWRYPGTWRYLNNYDIHYFKTYLPIMRDQILKLRKFCDMITELDDTMINANLEQLRDHILYLDILADQFTSLDEIIFIYLSNLYI